MVKFTLAILFFGFCFCSIAQDTTITITADQDTIFEIRIELKCIDELIYTDKSPVFPGGEKALNTFLETNIKYPEEALKHNEEGIVHVQFVINRNGTISDILVVKSVSKLLDAEAIRLIKLMPNWIPGEQGGRIIRVRVELPISFRILK